MLKAAILLSFFALQQPYSQNGGNSMMDWSGFIITVTNTVATEILNVLSGANFCQVYIPDNGTPQAIIITRNGSGSIRIPSGGGFKMPIRRQFAPGEQIFSVQTASSSTALQVLLMRKPF